MKTKIKNQEYIPLYERMEEIPYPKKNENPNDQKCQEILKKQSKGYGNNSESEGLNLAIEKKNMEIRAEAQKHCDHHYEVKYKETYTADARLALRRKISCEKCGFFQIDIMKEETKTSWI